MEFKSSTQSHAVKVIECNIENLDASNVRAFRNEMQELMKNEPKVVLNMAPLKFVDSSGLGALIACLREANGRKGDFRLCSMSRSVRALFELMRMHRVFGIYESVDDAVASFA